MKEFKWAIFKHITLVPEFIGLIAMIFSICNILDLPDFYGSYYVVNHFKKLLFYYILATNFE